MFSKQETLLQQSQCLTMLLYIFVSTTIVNTSARKTTGPGSTGSRVSGGCVFSNLSRRSRRNKVLGDWLLWDSLYFPGVHWKLVATGVQNRLGKTE